jgi:glycosyltransferase involved in cell wall biosynthesis
MRIFALSTWFPHPTVNGSTLRVYHLLRALASKHDVDLAAFTPLGVPPEESIRHLRSFCRSVTPIPRSPFTASRKMGWLSVTPRSLFESYAPAVRTLARDAADTADAAIGFQLSAARYLDGVKPPTIFEEAEPRQIEQPRQTEPFARRSRRRLTWWKHAAFLKRLAGRMQAVTVVSEAERASLARVGCDPSTIFLIPNGAEMNDLDRRRAPVGPRIVYAGSVTWEPNLDAVRWFLGEVLPKIKAVRSDVEFWVTGATDGVALDALPNRSWAHFTGQLPDVKGAIGDSAVCVAPIRAGGGTRLKILEAMALGTPVVSTHKGAEGLDVRPNDHLLIADDPDAFATDVLRVLGDDTLARRLSTNGRARVAEKYVWSVIGDEFNLVVTEAMERWQSRPRQAAR